MRRALVIAVLLAAIVVSVGAFRFRQKLRSEVRAVKEAGLKDTLKTVYHALQDVRQPPKIALPLPERADAPLVVFTESLGEGWQDWSWATHTLGPIASPYSGAASITMTPTGYKGVYFHHDPVSTDGYGALSFAVKSKSAFTVSVANTSGKFIKQVALPATSGAWVVKKISLRELGVKRAGDFITGVVFQDSTGSDQADAFFDEISFLPDPTLSPAPTKATIVVSVDVKRNRRDISPYIYGMAFAPPDYMSDLKLTVNRWGGNDKTRYNWFLGNADNAARDWNFANRIALDVKDPIPEGPSSAADFFVNQNKTNGAQTFLTVPTIGWVAKNTDNHTTSQNVPSLGGEPTSGSGAISGYDPAANRAETSVRSVARKSSAGEGEVAQDDWINHLVQVFGRGNAGGVKFYAMDNEPDLWDYTHTDIHPARMGYDDIINTFYDYAAAVKDADPTALVTGPVSWGWTGYLYSPLDKGNDNYHTNADRVRHGDTPLLLWFLKQARARDSKSGRRVLDILDVHYYPQGQNLYSGAHDPDTQKRRLRSTKSLWSGDYKDESWIGEPVRLVPRLKDWIAQGYPGTKIGITEWNFGGDTDISGGLATLDALGIFGRENVYLANFWAYPTKNGSTYLAFKLMRNADDNGNGFGDVSVSAVSRSDDRVSAYAALRKSDGATTVLLVNKMPKATVTVPVRLAPGSIPSGAKIATVTLLTQDGQALQKAAPVTLKYATATVTLPPYSAALVCIGGK